MYYRKILQWLMLCPCAVVWAGNLIENGSFEAGIDSRFAVDRWYIHGLPNAVLDQETKIHGRYSLRLPLSRIAYVADPRNVNGIAFRSSKPVILEAGKTYTFSTYVRSDHQVNGKLLLTSASPGDTRTGTVIEKSIGILPQWRRISLSYTPTKREHVYWLVKARSDGPGFFWLDGLQLEVGHQATDYRSFAPVEASITTDRIGKIFSSGESPEIDLRVFNDDVRVRPDVSFDMVVYDLAGKRIHEQRLIQTLPAGTGIRSKIRLPVLKNGIYRSELTETDSGRLAGELHFSVLPEPRKILPHDGTFGAYTTISPEPLAIMRRLGFTWIANLTSNGRMIYWNFVEPELGHFIWYDDDIAMVRKSGAELMFNLEPCRIPTWARRLPRKERMEKWKNYVGRMVEHYGAVVKYWTLADESHSVHTNAREKNCWANSADYVAWHVAGAEIIRSVGPDAKIILNTSAKFADKVLSILPENSVDILGGNFFHIKNGMEQIVQVSKKYNIPETWAPGVGPSSYPFYADHVLAEKRRSIPPTYWDDKNTALIKHVVGALGIGVKKLFHYTATYVGNTNRFSVFEADSALKPIGAQYGVLAWFLDGSVRAKRIKLEGYDKNLFVYRFDRADGMTVFPIWGLSSKQQILSFPRANGVKIFNIHDSFGNVVYSHNNDSEMQFRLGNRPVFLLVPNKDADKIEKSLLKLQNHMQQFPESWDVTIRGKYAVVRGAKDEYYRPPPNVSFWYRSTLEGWIEVLRSRSSIYPPKYDVNDQGLTIDWTVTPRPGAYHLEPGLIPKKFLHGASVDHLSGVPGNVRTIQAYRVDLVRFEKIPLNRGFPVAEMRSPHAIIIRSASGVTQTIETRYEGSEKVASGVWDLITRKDLDQAFLHRYIRNEPGPSPVKITVQVTVSD